MIKRKTEVQADIIKNLRAEKKSLLARINELEKIIEDNKAIVEAASTYRDKHIETEEALNKAKNKYLQAYKDIIVKRKMYKKEMDNLLKRIKENV